MAKSIKKKKKASSTSKKTAKKKVKPAKKKKAAPKAAKPKAKAKAAKPKPKPQPQPQPKAKAAKPKPAKKAPAAKSPKAVKAKPAARTLRPIRPVRKADPDIEEPGLPKGPLKPRYTPKELGEIREGLVSLLRDRNAEIESEVNEARDRDLDHITDESDIASSYRSFACMKASKKSVQMTANVGTPTSICGNCPGSYSATSISWKNTNPLALPPRSPLPIRVNPSPVSRKGWSADIDSPIRVCYGERFSQRSPRRLMRWPSGLSA